MKIEVSAEEATHLLADALVALRRMPRGSYTVTITSDPTDGLVRFTFESTAKNTEEKSVAEGDAG